MYVSVMYVSVMYVSVVYLSVIEEAHRRDLGRVVLSSHEEEK